MGSKIIEIFNKIAYNVLSALYQPFWAAVLLAFLTMFLYLYGKEHGWKKNNFIRNMFATWWRAFRGSSNFRRTFLLAFYTAMILLRTVLNREIWFDPLGDNAIIAANAAVVKDVRENEVVGGVPAKTIGENVEHKLYFGENEGIRK